MSDLPQNTIWSVPFGRNPFFTGREDLLQRLQTPLSEGPFPVRSITGSSGIGKTQLVCEFAYRRLQDYRAIFWVNAESREALFAGYDEIARLLTLPLKDYQEQKVVVQAVKRWLETTFHWLLIIDNVNRMDILSDFLPRNPAGQILITTSSSDPQSSDIVESLALEAFTPEQGAYFLLQRAGLFSPGTPLELDRASHSKMAVQISTDLDNIPLALEHAAAHIEVTGMSLAAYRRIYQHHRTKLSVQHPFPVAITTLIAFQRIEERIPAAADILCLCTFLGSMPLAQEVIIAGANALGGHFAHMAQDVYLFNQAIAELVASALISHNPQMRTLTVHRLVQEAMSRHILSTEKQRQWKQYAVNTISASFPDASFENWAICQRLLPHALLCVTWIEEEQIATPEAAYLLDRTGYYLSERQRNTGVEELYRRALTIREEKLGDSHLETITSMDNLAMFYKNQSRYVEAEALYKRALTVRKRIKVGKNEIARSQNRLALVYARQSKYLEAERLYKQALVIYQRHWRGEHPDMATSLNNLAVLYTRQGKYGEAERLYEQALDSRKRYKGTSHSDMATSLDSLAGLFENRGKYESAESFYKRALEIREQHMGAEHPDTANSLNNLALLYARQKKYESAEQFYKRALEICEQHLGAEHPATASIMNNEALLYEGQDKYKEAESLYQRALTICEQQLGSEHPDTATCLNNLALLFTKQGKYKEAERLYQRSLTIREQQLGGEHPFIAISLNNLAGLYASQRRYAEAEPLYKRALAIDQKAYGEEHAEIVTDLNNLACLYMKQNEYEQAKPLLTRARDILEQTLDPEHPNISVVLGNLALILQEKQLYDEAEEYYREGLRIDRAFYGMRHSIIATDLSNLGALFYLRGGYGEAEYFFRQALEIDQSLLDDSHPRLLLRFENLAHTLMALGRQEEATQLRAHAERIRGRQTDSIPFDTSERKES